MATEMQTEHQSNISVEQQSLINDIHGKSTSIKRHLPSSIVNRDPRKLAKHDTNEIVISNKFQILQDLPEDQSDPAIGVKIKKPPPIHIANVTNYGNLVTALKSISGDQIFHCKSTLKEVVVYPQTPTLYRRIVHYLRSENILFHTYQLFEDKLMRVVIRGLHHSTPISSIISALNDEGFEVKNIVNVINRDKIPLPLFFVDLTQNKNNTNIYSLKYLLHSVISIEEPRRKNVIVQCGRCQGLGHTKSYCNYQPKCVRCAGPHLTAQCTKSRQTPATCALCGSNHPANYKGCTVYKDLQRQRNPVPKKTIPSTPAPQNVPKPLQSSQETHFSTPPPMNEKNFPTLPNAPPHHQQNRRTENVSRNSTSTSFVNAVNGNHNSAIGSDQLLHTMSNFILELKNLIFPIITLLSQITQTLCSQNVK
jgi:hypothetical protein